MGWPAGRSKLFKDSNAGELFKKYCDRIGKDFACESKTINFEELFKVSGLIWVCERSQKSRMYSSADLAEQFQNVCDGGIKQLTIWIGGPDGVAKENLEKLKPNLTWSFGPMTLPHELAAVVAAEQIYRAISILKNHPYHQGH